MHKPIANAILHAAASEITILTDHDEPLGVEIKCVRHGLYVFQTTSPCRIVFSLTACWETNWSR